MSRSLSRRSSKSSVVAIDDDSRAKWNAFLAGAVGDYGTLYPGGHPVPFSAPKGYQLSDIIPIDDKFQPVVRYTPSDSIQRVALRFVKFDESMQVLDHLDYIISGQMESMKRIPKIDVPLKGPLAVVRVWVEEGLIRGITRGYFKVSTKGLIPSTNFFASVCPLLVAPSLKEHCIWGNEGFGSVKVKFGESHTIQALELDGECVCGSLKGSGKVYSFSKQGFVVHDVSLDCIKLINQNGQITEISSKGISLELKSPNNDGKETDEKRPMVDVNVQKGMTEHILGLQVYTRDGRVVGMRKSILMLEPDSIDSKNDTDALKSQLVFTMHHPITNGELVFSHAGKLSRLVGIRMQSVQKDDAAAVILFFIGSVVPAALYAWDTFDPDDRVSAKASEITFALYYILPFAFKVGFKTLRTWPIIMGYLFINTILYLASDIYNGIREDSQHFVYAVWNIIYNTMLAALILSKGRVRDICGLRFDYSFEIGMDYFDYIKIGIAAVLLLDKISDDNFASTINPILIVYFAAMNNLPEDYLMFRTVIVAFGVLVTIVLFFADTDLDLSNKQRLTLSVGNVGAYLVFLICNINKGPQDMPLLKFLMCLNPEVRDAEQEIVDIASLEAAHNPYAMDSKLKPNEIQEKKSSRFMNINRGRSNVGLSQKEIG
ncbi:hypothetical protein AAMO2058_000643700 [Amorphochlora amoebiformis]